MKNNYSQGLTVSPLAFLLQLPSSQNKSFAPALFSEHLASPRCLPYAFAHAISSGIVPPYLWSLWGQKPTLGHPWTPRGPSVASAYKKLYDKHSLKWTEFWLLTSVIIIVIISQGKHGFTKLYCSSFLIWREKPDFQEKKRSESK